MARNGRPSYDHVPMGVIKRLPRYYRYLGELVEKKVERISSQKLARMMGISASQLRQDLTTLANSASRVTVTGLRISTTKSAGSSASSTNTT